MGTVHYLPPEQAQGKGSTIRSDIYSMGIMMYELLTGLVPYKGDNAVEIALKHLKEPLPSVRKQNPSVPQSLENVIIRATAKNPKNRYNDAREMHEDLKTALDESRKDEKRYVYKYPENDLEDTKKLDQELATIQKAEASKKVEKTDTKKKVEEEDSDDKRRGKKTLIVFLSLFTALVLVTTIVAMVFFEKEGKVQTKIIPDVSGKSIVDATNTLIDAGFDVSTEYKYVSSDTIEEDNVVKTSPEMGTKRKKGSTITLYVSTGESVYIIEDFTGENYLEAKGKIESKCECNVLVETEKVDEKAKAKEETVLRTEPAAGESSKLGNPIKIIIPEVEYKYPDFTSGYTITKVEDFCREHELKLEIKYEETSKYSEGSIIRQSRSAGSVVTPGASLSITIAKKPAPEPEPEVETNNDTGE